MSVVLDYMDGWRDGYYDREPEKQLNYQYMRGWEVGEEDRWDDVACDPDDPDNDG